MKRLLPIYALIIFFFLFSMPVWSAGYSQNAEISKIENELYGFDYNKEQTQKRLERLETSIYGKTQNGDIPQRIRKLATDITADQIGQEITPSEDTFRETEEVADNSVSYPIVDEIEMKLFNTTYKNRDFHTRIVTIERKLFGKIYDVEDYSTRMDRIKSKIMPETIAHDASKMRDYSDTGLSSNDLSGTNSSRFSFPFGQQRLTRPYANYGDYSDEITGAAAGTVNDDLSQMEYETFGTEFSNDDTKTRLRRLNSANNAKKSKFRYDSQKFQQRMSTAMEIGAMILMILAMVL